MRKEVKEFCRNNKVDPYKVIDTMDLGGTWEIHRMLNWYHEKYVDKKKEDRWTPEIDYHGNVHIDCKIQNTTKKEKNLYKITYRIQWLSFNDTDSYEHVVASSSNKAVKKFKKLHDKKVIMVELVSEDIIV